MSSIYYLRNVPVTRQTQSQKEFTESECNSCKTSQRNSKNQINMPLEEEPQDSTPKFSSDPISESELSNDAAEAGNNLQQEGSFSKDHGSPKDSNLLKKCNVGLEISKTPEGMRISFDVSQSSLEMIFSALQTSIMPFLQKERLESNCEVCNSRDDHNQINIVENSEGIEQCVDPECEKSKPKTPEQSAEYISGNDALNEEECHGENIDVCIQTEPSTNNSTPSSSFISTISNSTTTNGLSNGADSKYAKRNMPENRKSIASLDLNDKSMSGSTGEMLLNDSENPEALVLNESETKSVKEDNTPESSISSLSNEELDAVLVEEKEHLKLCKDMQHDNENVAHVQPIMFSSHEHDHSLHDSEKNVKNAIRYSDEKSMSKEVTSENQIEFIENTEHSVNEYSTPKEGGTSGSDLKDSSFKNDSLTSKCAENTKQQPISEENIDIEKLSKANDVVNATVSELEGVASKVVALAQYLDFKGIQNVTDETANLSTSIKKFNADQSRELDSFETSNALMKSYDDEKIVAVSLPDVSDKDNGHPFESTPRKTYFQTEKLATNERNSEESIIHCSSEIPVDQNTSQYIETKTGFESPKTEKRNDESGVNSLELGLSNTIEEEDVEALKSKIHIENDKNYESQVVLSDVKPDDSKERESSVLDNSSIIQKDSREQENILENTALLANAIQNCDVDKSISSDVTLSNKTEDPSGFLFSSISGEVHENLSLNESNDPDNSLKTPDSISTDKHNNRRTSVIDTSRNEFLQNILESSSMSIESDLNDRLTASKNQDLKKKIDADSKVEVVKVIQETSSCERITPFSNISLKNENVITSDKSSSEFQEHESIEREDSMLISSLGFNKIKSIEENRQISNENTLTVPQPNMATNVKTLKDIDPDVEKEECCPQPVNNLIVSNEDICCGSESFDSNAKLKDTCSKKNTDNCFNFAEKNATDEGLCSESKEKTPQKLNRKDIAGTPLNTSTETHVLDEESIDSRKTFNVELTGTSLKDLNNTNLVSDKTSILEHKEIHTVKIQSTYFKDSLFSEEGSVVKQEDLKLLEEKVIASEEEPIVEKYHMKETELAEDLLKASEDGVVSKDSMVDQEDILSAHIEGAELKTCNENAIVFEKPRIEQEKTQSVEPAGTDIAVFSQDDPVLEEYTVDKATQNVKGAEFKVLNEDVLVSEESMLRQEENKSFELAGMGLKVLDKNVLVSEEMSVVKQKSIQSDEDISMTEHYALENKCPSRAEDKENVFPKENSGDLESSMIKEKLANEFLEEHGKNKQNSIQGFNIPETNCTADNKIQNIQIERAASDPSTKLNTENIKIKYRSSVSSNNLQKSEDVISNFAPEHSPNDSTTNSLNFANKDGEKSIDVVSEDLLNKSVESNCGSGEAVELPKSLENKSELINSKTPKIDVKDHDVGNENIQHTCKDIVKNAIAIFTSPNHPKRSSNTNSQELHDESMKTPKKSLNAEQSFNSADKTLSLSYSPEIQISEFSPNELKAKQVENVLSTDSISELPLSGSKTDCLPTEDVMNESPNCDKEPEETLSKKDQTVERNLDESVIIDDSNQVSSSSETSVVNEHEVNTTYHVSSSDECNKHMCQSFNTKANESENAPNYKSESENSVSTQDEIDAAPTRHRTFLEAKIISPSVEKIEVVGNTQSKLNTRMSKTKSSVRKTEDSLVIRRNDRCKSEEPVAGSSKTAKPIQTRRSSESLVRRISNEFQSKIESLPHPSSTRLSKQKNVSSDSNLSTQKTLKKTKSLQEDAVPTKSTRSKVKAGVDSSESDQSEASAENVSTPNKQRIRTRNAVLTEKTRSSRSLEMVLEESITPRKKLRDNAANNLKEAVPAKVAKVAKAKGTVDSSESDQSELNAETASTPVKQRARTRNPALSNKMKSFNSLEKVSEESTPTRRTIRDKNKTPVVKQNPVEPSSAAPNPTSKRSRARNTDVESKTADNSKKPSRAGKE